MVRPDAMTRLQWQAPDRERTLLGYARGDLVRSLSARYDTPDQQRVLNAVLPEFPVAQHCTLVDPFGDGDEGLVIDVVPYRRPVLLLDPTEIGNVLRVPRTRKFRYSKAKQRQNFGVSLCAALGDRQVLAMLERDFLALDRDTEREILVPAADVGNALRMQTEYLFGGATSFRRITGYADLLLHHPDLRGMEVENVRQFFSERDPSIDRVRPAKVAARVEEYRRGVGDGAAAALH